MKSPTDLTTVQPRFSRALGFAATTTAEGLRIGDVVRGAKVRGGQSVELVNYLEI